jgi:hypothetical protein
LLKLELCRVRLFRRSFLRRSRGHEVPFPLPAMLPHSQPYRRLRYQHRETQQLAVFYEDMLRHLSERYG